MILRLLQSLAVALALVAPVRANQYFNTPTPSTTTGTAWQSISGDFYLAASSANVSSTTANILTKSTWTIHLDGKNGNITANTYIGPQWTAVNASTNATAATLTSLQSQINGKQASFVGITSSCPSGYYLSTGTWVNGVLTGGTCVQAGTGGGMVSSMAFQDFLSSCTGSQTDFALASPPSVSYSSGVFVNLDNTFLTPGRDFNIVGSSVVRMAVAPPSNSTRFGVYFMINTSTLPAVALLNVGQSFSQPQSFPVGISGVFTGTVFASTYTALPDYTATQSSLGVCIPGSTVTFTTQNVPLHFSGMVGNRLNSQNDLNCYAILVDGAFISGASSSHSNFCDTSYQAYTTMTISFDTSGSVSAGSHSFCLTFANQASDAPVASTPSGAFFGATNFWKVSEAH